MIYDIRDTPHPYRSVWKVVLGKEGGRGWLPLRDTLIRNVNNTISNENKVSDQRSNEKSKTFVCISTAFSHCFGAILYQDEHCGTINRGFFEVNPTKRSKTRKADFYTANNRFLLNISITRRWNFFPKPLKLRYFKCLSNRHSVTKGSILPRELSDIGFSSFILRFGWSHLLADFKLELIQKMCVWLSPLCGMYSELLEFFKFSIRETNLLYCEYLK